MPVESGVGTGGWQTLAMEWSPDRDALRGRLAVVAGATRGAGRGIAAALGEAGATVVCTGRSTRSTGSTRSDYDRAETIEESAELVTHLGGTGIAAAVDHLDTAQVKSLAEQIRSDHGHVDVLVNDIWGGELLKGGPSEWNTPIWEHDLHKGLRILRLAIDTHLITSHHLLPLLIDKQGGLLVEVTDGTADYNSSRYRLSVFYDLAKVAVNRLAFSQGHELEPHGATAVAITPGWLRSEMMLDNFGVSEENWRDALGPRAVDNYPSAPADFALSESPRYVGRAIVALASDPDRTRWNQKSVSSGQLAHEYGFTDLDGSQPDIWRFIEEIREGDLDGNPDGYR
jgi:NAD(P)-dependent dehydrogenase (short-subunit alcohol dehydrogenase family)